MLLAQLWNVASRVIAFSVIWYVICSNCCQTRDSLLGGRHCWVSRWESVLNEKKTSSHSSLAWVSIKYLDKFSCTRWARVALELCHRLKGRNDHLSDRYHARGAQRENEENHAPICYICFHPMLSIERHLSSLLNSGPSYQVYICLAHVGPLSILAEHKYTVCFWCDISKRCSRGSNTSQ